MQVSVGGRNPHFLIPAAGAMANSDSEEALDRLYIDIRRTSLNGMPSSTGRCSVGGPTPALSPCKAQQYRVVVLGPSRVGKTSLIRRFLYDAFPSDYKATVEDYHRNTYDAGHGAEVTLEILDTSGSDEFPAMRDLAVSSGDAFLLVYAVDDDASFDAVRRLRDMVLSLRRGNVPVVVVGNKGDLPRKVRREVAESVATMDWEHGFVECSAKDGDGVPDAFRALLTQSRLPLTLQDTQGEKRRQSLPVFGSRGAKDPSLTPKRNSCAMS